jgi:hypothetical protein
VIDFVCFGIRDVLPPQYLGRAAYLQIGESRRDGDRVRQQVIATLAGVRSTAG